MAALNQNEQRRIPFHVYTDLGMALIYIGLSIFVMVTRKFGNFEFSGWGAYAFIGLLSLYGIFRLYRGVIGYKNR